LLPRARQAGEAQAKERPMLDLAARRSQRYAELKAAVLAHYGTVCACCGTTESLTIDHIDGDGRQHRIAMTSPRNRIGDLGAATMYTWLIKNGFPAGFQTLCKPCNSSKGTGERCRIDHIGGTKRRKQ
jgi:hypothetical protein